MDAKSLEKLTSQIEEDPSAHTVNLIQAIKGLDQTLKHHAQLLSKLSHLPKKASSNINKEDIPGNPEILKKRKDDKVGTLQTALYIIINIYHCFEYSVL